jgi:stage II sporulation protein D
VKNLKQLNNLFFLIPVGLFIGCAGGPFLLPAPDAYKQQIASPDSSVLQSSQTDTMLPAIDFSSAIPDIQSSGDECNTAAPVKNSDSLSNDSSVSAKILEVESTRYQSFTVPTKIVRVALLERERQVNLYSTGAVSLHSGGRIFTPLRGRVHFQKKSSGTVIVENAGIAKEIFLPCTVTSVNKYNFIDCDEKSYRGSFAVYSTSGNELLLVNILEVEEYLRGVVPLEIGKRGEEDMEALKAQSVAARTYTYKKIVEKKDCQFDLYSTVSDQVYGGANVEYREADIAIKMTENIIITCKDSIIYAYYHSTCGGKTASIPDVWPEKSPQTYLVSVSDLKSNGESYCSISNYFSWQEHWPNNRFKGILLKNLERNCIFESGKINNDILNVRIVDKSESGRVKTLLVEGNGWKRRITADRIRYVLRRATPELSILRSANFIIESYNSRDVVISGKGYGHGVGMCQMGAIGRARAGQKFDTILKTYYTGTQLSMCVAR